MDVPPDTAPGSITTAQYWDDAWNGLELPDPIEPDGTAPINHLHRQLHREFADQFRQRVGPGSRLVEIGCGASQWLPYFHRTFGFEVSGIDYSPEGIRRVEHILARSGTPATVVEADMFAPPDRFVEAFDVVVSFGVVEHFTDTADAIRACARFLRPGGLMITEVPTMSGLYGLAYKTLRPAIYAKHVPQTRERLAAAHERAGLRVLRSTYLLGAPVPLSRPAPQASALTRLGFMAARGYFSLEDRGLGMPPNRFTSPYALCAAERPATQ